MIKTILPFHSMIFILIQIINEFSLTENSTLQVASYIAVSTDGDLTAFDTGIRLRHKYCNKETPSSCSDLWEYHTVDGFREDKSIKVSCGISFTLSLFNFWLL